jgi:carotenoid cleavage dioxygenase-like enzyme
VARPFQTTLQACTGPSRPHEAVAGRLLGIHRGVLHSIQIHHGRELSYWSHRIRSDGATDGSDRELMVFGGSILTFGHGTLAQRLSPDLGSSAPVDLAGQSRRLAACPRRDPISGDLHLLATAPDGSQAHVVVSSGALTRRHRPIVDPPNRVIDLAIAGDHVLFATGGFLGIGARDLETGVHWIPIDVGSPALVHAQATDDSLLVVVLTPSLERWAIDPASRSIGREVLDPTPQRLARTNHSMSGTARPLIWTIGDRTVDTHDLATGRHINRRFDHRQPGDLAFVNDPTRLHDTDGGWLVGIVRASDRDVELVLLDAADVAGPVVAAARLPALIPPDLHTVWIPSTSQWPEQGDRS